MSGSANKPAAPKARRTFGSPFTSSSPKTSSSPNTSSSPSWKNTSGPVATVTPKTNSTATPKKLSSSRIQNLGQLVSPSPQSAKTPLSSPKPRKQIDLTKGATADTESQEQTDQSDRAKNAVVVPKSASEEQDWDLLYELAQYYDLYKNHEAEEITKQASSPPAPTPTSEDEPPDKESFKNKLQGVMGGNYTTNGSFLTAEFIGQHLVEDKKYETLSFEFSGQKLFKRFDRKDDERKKIIAMFVDALLKHPRSGQITALNFSSSLIPGAFLDQLSSRCMENGAKHLPQLRVLNLEGNLLDDEGIMGLSKAIADRLTWPRLQVLKLENQKRALTADAEAALGVAILESPTLVVVGLRVVGKLERQQINNTMATNIDNLRQARRKYKEKTGTLEERKRNEMEQYFDKIAQNDPSITVVDLVGNLKFLALSATEKSKAGAAFATNSHVISVSMVKLKLDDAFCAAFGQALAKNTTLGKVLLDSNDFSGTGMKALMEGLGRNTSVVEFQARHQSKTTASTDEKEFPGLLEKNRTVIKLGVDLRDQHVKMQLDRKANENREIQRKLRAASKPK